MHRPHDTRFGMSMPVSSRSTVIDAPLVGLLERLDQPAPESRICKGDQRGNCRSGNCGNIASNASARVRSVCSWVMAKMMVLPGNCPTWSLRDPPPDPPPTAEGVAVADGALNFSVGIVERVGDEPGQLSTLGALLRSGQPRGSPDAGSVSWRRKDRKSTRSPVIHGLGIAGTGRLSQSNSRKVFGGPKSWAWRSTTEPRGIEVEQHLVPLVEDRTMTPSVSSNSGRRKQLLRVCSVAT